MLRAVLVFLFAQRRAAELPLATSAAPLSNQRTPSPAAACHWLRYAAVRPIDNGVLHLRKKFVASLLAVAIASTTACAQLGISKEQAGTVIGGLAGVAIGSTWAVATARLPPR